MTLQIGVCYNGVPSKSFGSRTNRKKYTVVAQVIVGNMDENRDDLYSLQKRIDAQQKEIAALQKELAEEKRRNADAASNPPNNGCPSAVTRTGHGNTARRCCSLSPSLPAPARPTC